MTRKRSVFAPLSVHYSRDAAIAAVGEAAELLFVRSLAYCKGTDDTGFIPEYELPVVGARLPKLGQRVEALVREELWVRLPGGWQIRSWEAWNSDLVATTRREQARQRQRAKRDRERDCHADVTPVTRDGRDSHTPQLNTTQLKQENHCETPSPSRKTTREPDPIWDALVAACRLNPQEITDSARGALNKAVKELRKVNATAELIRERAATHETVWPDMSLTPSSLSRHWSELAALDRPRTAQASYGGWK